VTFGPRIDGDFFPKDLPELIREAPKKSLVIGGTSEESLAWTLISPYNNTCSQLAIPTEKLSNFSNKDVEGLVRGHLVVDEFFKNQTKEVQDKVLEFYLKSNGRKIDNVFYLQRYTQLFSDLQFNIPIMWEILLRIFSGWTVFTYHSPYFNPVTIPERCPVKESYHGSDQHYNQPGDVEMESVMSQWLVSFVKTG
jgi:hypothetical protein